MVNERLGLGPAAKLAVQVFQGVGCADRLPHCTRELVAREEVATCLLQASSDGRRQRVPFGYEDRQSIFPTMERKRALYKGIFRTLRPAGVFVNADVTMSAHPVRQEQCYRIWAGHLVSCGIDEPRAYEHFDELGVPKTPTSRSTTSLPPCAKPDLTLNVPGGNLRILF